MAYHDNLRTIPLTGNVSGSEEDGEIEKEGPSKEALTNDDDSDSSKDEDDDSLDIKPPQVFTKTRDRHHDDRKRSHHSRKHESHRREHHRGSNRGSQRESFPSYPSDSGRKPPKVTESRTVRYRDNPSRDKEKDNRKTASEIRNVRESRTSKKDSRDRSIDSKTKDESHLLEEKKMEWRKKRILFMEKKREQGKEINDRSNSSREDNQSGSRDLREKLKEKQRIQQERERRLKRFRSPPKEEEIKAVSTKEVKSNELHITPEPEEAMDFEEDNAEEESEQEKEGESEKESDKEETGSGSENSSDSGTEGSNHSKMEEEEEDAEDSSEEEEEEEVEEPKKVETKPPSPTKSPPPKPVVKDPPPKVLEYFPAVQGCRSVEEFKCINKIEEGTYGIVFRAQDKKTNEFVALKRLKMEKEKEGFPITALREINTLLKSQHANIVTVREIVVGSNMDKIYIVMDFVEHDLKSLMKTMKQPFLVGEVKTLMIQLLAAVAHLHDNWILHRDLKTSNILLSHKGILKVGDFGLAREYGSPLKKYTEVVVTLWYRAPELLLKAKQYSCPIDLWSVGCIFAELLTMKPLFPGESEIDQLKRIFKDLGTPSEKIWPGYNELPVVKDVKFDEFPYNNLRSRFGHNFTDLGFDLLNRFLTYNPSRRITAEEAKSHDFFHKEKPKPVSPSMFPTWPARSELGTRKVHSSPKPPSGGKQYAGLMGEADDEGLIRAAGFHMEGAQEGTSAKSVGFSLKF